MQIKGWPFQPSDLFFLGGGGGGGGGVGKAEYEAKHNKVSNYIAQ